MDLGYQKRFGLLFMDYDTQRRRPKRSAKVYSQIARTNELPALDVVLGTS
jgi:beta-glucosidase